LTHINGESDIIVTINGAGLHTPVVKPPLTILKSIPCYSGNRRRLHRPTTVCEPCADIRAGTVPVPVAWQGRPLCPPVASLPTKEPSCPLETRPGFFAPLDHDRGLSRP